MVIKGTKGNASPTEHLAILVRVFRKQHITSFLGKIRIYHISVRKGKIAECWVPSAGGHLSESKSATKRKAFLHFALNLWFLQLTFVFGRLLLLVAPSALVSANMNVCLRQQLHVRRAEHITSHQQQQYQPRQQHIYIYILLSDRSWNWSRNESRSTYTV